MKIDYSAQGGPVVFSPASREQCLEELTNSQYAICIIGGGITGAGIARDAALRGLKTILVEKADFGSGTSSKSSKLVHGGFRYLKTYEFGLVHEALQERYVLLNLAPHLVKRLPSFFPVYKGAPDGFWKITAGMCLYDLLCGFKGIGLHHMHSRQGLMQMVSQLREDKLVGGATYFDATTDDVRLVMATLQSAVQAGCRVLNYVRALGFEKQGNKVTALGIRDERSGKSYTIHADTFVNATGVWSDQIRRLADPNAPQQVRTTSGIHLIVDRERLPLTRAAMIISVLDNRPIFVIPWQNFTLLGTTDTDFNGAPEAVSALPGEISYLLQSLNFYFPGVKLTEADIISSFAGLRPLVFEPGKPPSAVTREHKILQGPENLFSIVGGKLTTYRRMAQDLLRYVARRTSIPIRRHSTTARYPLYGGEVADFNGFATSKMAEVVQKYGMGEQTAVYLLNTYGSRTDDVLRYAESDATAKGTIVAGLPYIFAQIPYAIEHEMTFTLDDFMSRRTHILWFDRLHGKAVAEQVAERMGKYLGWSEMEKAKQVNEYLQKV